MKIKNRMDTFYYVIGNLYFIICFLLLGIIFFFHVNMVYVIVALFLMLILIFLYILYFNRYYIFEKDYIIIKIGPFSKKLEFKDIEKCFITDNYKFSFATSVKRIGIKLKEKLIYISPENMNDFLNKLIRRCNNKGAKKRKR
ncbi:MAG: hypothetical protein GX951_04270 [Mollicutes bacterium]|nr:hypothetical protein [Mollicutes bacterium]